MMKSKLIIASALFAGVQGLKMQGMKLKKATGGGDLLSQIMNVRAGIANVAIYAGANHPKMLELKKTLKRLEEETDKPSPRRWTAAKLKKAQESFVEAAWKGAKFLGNGAYGGVWRMTFAQEEVAVKVGYGLKHECDTLNKIKSPYVGTCF